MQKLIIVIAALLLMGCACLCKPPFQPNPNLNEYLCWYYPDWYIEYKIEGLECDNWQPNIQKNQPKHESPEMVAR